MKKKKIEKILVLTLALTVVCSAFTACGSGSSEESSKTAESESAESQAAENEDAESEATESSDDNSGDTNDLVSSFLESTESGSSDDADATIEYDASGTVVAGTYTYEDYKADMDFSIIWTLTLNEDGSYDLSEDNPFIGVTEYGGQTSETDGNRLTCGEMDADRSTTEGDWAYPTGFSVLVDSDSMTFVPENISDEVFGRDEDMTEGMTEE